MELSEEQLAILSSFVQELTGNETENNKDSEWIVDANSVVRFRIVWEESDMEGDKGTFSPGMCHQIFGPEEELYGYKDPIIDVFFSAGNMNPFIQFRYSSLIDAGGIDDREPDDVIHILKDKLITFEGSDTNGTVCGRNVTLSKETFLQNVKTSFTPPGKLASGFSVGNEERSFEIWEGTFGDPSIVRLHENVQTFVLWYVDASSFLDMSDPKWRIFYLWEKRRIEGSVKYAMAGFCSTYQFFIWPDRERMSISQFLVLPPYQKMGNGEKLLRAVYEYAWNDERISDIVAELAVLDFTKLRDKTDLEICEEKGYFQFSSGNAPKYEKVDVMEIQNNLKLYKHQIRRCYEVLRMFGLKTGDIRQWREFEYDVKKRIYAQQRDTLLQTKPELRTQHIQDHFQKTVDYYRELLSSHSNL